LKFAAAGLYFNARRGRRVQLSGDFTEGTTATDLVLRAPCMLREAEVRVGKFVEFFCMKARNLQPPTAPTIATGL